MADKTTIYTKLLEFQKLGISIRKDKKNPHFKSSYADISEVLDKVKPALSDCGITLIQMPQSDGLLTRLYDSNDGTFVDGFLPYIGATDPQKLGSNLTYLRRYALVAMLGLEDDDDDGNQASARVVPGVAGVAGVALKAPVEETPKPMTVATAMKMLRASTTEAGLEVTYKALPANLQKDPEVIATGAEVRQQIINK